jgi:hypothetical protein
VDDADAIGKMGHLREDVAGHEHRNAVLVCQPSQQLANLDDPRRVEPADRVDISVVLCESVCVHDRR